MALMTDEQLYHSVLAHQDAVNKVRDRVLQFVEQRWNNLSSWRDADIARFVSQIVPAVEAGQVAVYRLTDAYLEQVLVGMGADPAAFVPVNTALATGATAETYGGVGPTVWWSLSEGKPLTEAVNAGLIQALRQVKDDMDEAQLKASANKVQSGDRNVGYRRTLNGSVNCVVCRLASTQRYHSGNLRKIHNRCDCGVAPIYGDRDPGQVINKEYLSQIREEQAAETERKSR